jgi:hypothetical protein
MCSIESLRAPAHSSSYADVLHRIRAALGRGSALPGAPMNAGARAACALTSLERGSHAASQIASRPANVIVGLPLTARI